MNETMPLTVGLGNSAVETASPVAEAVRERRAAPSIALFVLGMHRSGTSAVGGVLSRLGIDLGTQLMPPTRDNPKGYFEHQDIVAVHDGLLTALGVTWDGVRRLPAGWQDGPAAHVARTALKEIVARDFAGAALWGLKDPRLCRLMPLWRPLLSELAVDARYLLVLRRPAEVASSLAARDRIGAPRAKLLWLRHVLEAEAASRGQRRAILHYRELIEDAEGWPRIVTGLARDLGVAWPIPVAEAKPAIEQLLAPELWHHRKTELDLALPDLHGWVETVESAFADADGPRLHEICDRVMGEVDRADELMGEMIAELERGFIALARARAPTAPASPPQTPKPVPAAPAAQPETVTDPDYAKWIAARATTAFARDDWMAEKIATWQTQSKFALGMVLPAGTEGRLAPTLRSLQAQVTGDWELHVVIAGDPPLGLEGESRLIRHPAAGRPIATLNRVLAESGADWVGLVDGGDQLAGHTLFELNLSVDRHPEWFAFYTDEDRIDSAGTHSAAQFKPDLNLDLLRSMPYVGGLLAVRRAVFQELGGFSTRWDGLEECDLALRLAERGDIGSFGHVPDVLYHRYTQSGRSLRPVAAICGDLPKLVQAHLDRIGVKATAEPGARPLFCRVRYAHDGAEPLVSIVIPTKNQLPLLKRCVETVLRITKYENYEILIVDNGSTSQDAIEYLRAIEEKAAEIGSRLRVLRHPGPFNFSAMNNHAVREARGAYICLLNNDAAPLDGDWLTEMMQHARRPEVGVVGAKLFYPDGRVQHGGVILGIGWGSPADHPYNGVPGNSLGYWGRLQVQQDFSAVTAACMVTRRSLYDELRGLDEECLRGLLQRCRLLPARARKGLSRGVDALRQVAARDQRQLAQQRRRGQGTQGKGRPLRPRKGQHV